MFIEIFYKILLFKGGVLIYAEHCMFSFVMCLLATRRTFLLEFVVIGTTLKSGNV